MLDNLDSAGPRFQSVSGRLKPSVKKNVITEIYYNPKLEQKLAVIEPKSKVDLSYWHLIDADMSIVYKRIIKNKQSIELCLCGNQLSSQGASILAFRLPTNSTLRTLDLSYNRITDAGVYSLSEVLLPTHCFLLEKLLLNKNGITNDGMQYLAEMFKTNQTLTDLSLSDNEIGDEGVRQLANVLNKYNTTLKVLILSFNVFITDSSVDHLLNMLEHNQTLTKLAIKQCNLSEIGKTKLREKVNGKKDFQIEV